MHKNGRKRYDRFICQLKTIFFVVEEIDCSFKFKKKNNNSMTEMFSTNFRSYAL